MNSTIITLHDGTRMPLLGLGLYEMDAAQTRRAVRAALDAGYRLIDSAEWYENERPAGDALRAFLADDTTHPHLSRADLCFETKMMHNRGREEGLEAVRRSLDESGLDYIDLYLLHSPLGGPQLRRASWEAVLAAKKAGHVRSVGVSNFGVRHLREITENFKREDWPTVNQIDLHPFMTREDIVQFCRAHDIALQAWAPLVRAHRLTHPTLTRIATKHSRTPAQVLIRWSLQKGFAPIPKSTSPARIIENSAVFDWALDEEDMHALGALNEDLETDWEVTRVE